MPLPPKPRPAPGPNQKTMVFELFTDVFVQTDATTGLVYTDLDCSAFEELAPYIQSMYVLTWTGNRTSDHQWGIYASWTNTGRTWSTPTLIQGALVTANGEAIQGEYSTYANFAGRRFKVVIGTRNGTAGARESASCSAWLVIYLRT